MFVRDNLYRFLVLFISLFILILGNLVLGSELYGQEVLPLSEVKPGMECYGLTVFKGDKRERFECEILGISGSLAERGKTIRVRIFGGPDNGQLLRDTRIMSGMSGSPIYNKDGLLIGSILSTEPFLKEAYGALRPAEDTMGLEKLVDLENNKLLSTVNAGGMQLFKPGEAAATCLVWNDEEGIVCAFMTVIDVKTFDHVPTVYLAGHNMRFFNKGSMATPLFKANVVASIPSLAFSSKDFNTVGKTIGAVVYNNPFGLVGKIGAEAKYFSFAVTVVDANSQKIKTDKYYFSYNKILTPLFQFLINSYTEMFDETGDAAISYDVYTADSGILSVESKMWDAIPTLSSPGMPIETEPLTLLDEIKMLLDWEELNPNINIIDLKIKVREKYKILKLVKATAENLAVGKEEFSIVVTFKDENENEKIFSFVHKLAKKYNGKKISLASGNVLADEILKRKMSRAVSLPLLNEIRNRNLLYLYYVADDFTDTDENATAEKLDGKQGQTTPKEQGWVTDEKTTKEPVEIIGSIEPPKDHIFLGKRDFVVKQAVAETKKSKPKKFLFF